MNFGDINHFILLGGGKLLLESAIMLKEEGVSVFVVTSERHSREIIGNNETLIESIKCNNIAHVISCEVTMDPNVIRMITEKTIGISIGAAWVFKKSFIDLFNGRLINLHPTRLPQNRGGGIFSWMALRNERTGICLIHQVDVGVDSGNIILFEEYIYPSYCRLPSEYQEYSINEYKKLLRKFLQFIKEKITFDLIPQQNVFSAYWPRLQTDIHGYIDWSWKLRDIEQFVCAFDDPYNGASTFLNSVRVRFRKCCSSFVDGSFHPFQKGIIYRITAETIFVAADQGTLLVNSVLGETGADIKAKLKLGDRFYTAVHYLEKAKQYRVVYTAKGIKD